MNEEELNVFDENETATLNNLVSSGNINKYTVTKYGVEIEFIDGTTVEFSANSGGYDGECPYLSVEEKA